MSVLIKGIDIPKKHYMNCYYIDDDGKVFDVSRKNVVGKAVQMPSAQPERLTGHWVEIGDEPYDEWECDMCGFVIDGSGCIDPEEYKDVYKFCPRCGARMV